MVNQLKHLLIILISFLLLSSFLTSCEKKEETFYRWKNPSDDGYIWKRFGDKQTQPRYQGEIKREYILFGDYILEGLGSEISPDGGKYVGSWKNGEKNGQGTYTWSDGSKYVGEFKDDKRNGQGTYTSHNGKYIVGEYKDDLPWNGTQYEKDGNITYKIVNGKTIK